MHNHVGVCVYIYIYIYIYIHTHTHIYMVCKSNDYFLNPFGTITFTNKF